MSLLRLLTWASPAFPTGGFAYSHGLEWAVEAGDVTTEAAALDWIGAVLADGTGRSDAILLRAAWREHPHPSPSPQAEEGPAKPSPAYGGGLGGGLSCSKRQKISHPNSVAAIATALASSRERLEETLHQGHAFALAAAVWSGPAEPAPYPVAFGQLARQQGVPEDDAVRAMLHALAANLVSAAVRLVPLGQTAGLRILHALEPTIEQLATETQSATLDDIGSACFRADIAAMRHETQHTRLFRS